MTIKEMREARAKAVAEARKIHDKAQAEKREMTAEDTQAFDRHMEEEHELRQKIEAEEQKESRAAWLTESEQDLSKSAGRKTEPTEPENRSRERGGDGENRDGRIVIESRGRKFIAEERSDLHRRNAAGYQEEYRNWLVNGEKRSLQMDLDIKGGFIVTPESFVAELIRNVDDALPMRDLVRKFTVVDAASLGVPTLTDKMSTFRRGTEIGAPTPDTSLKFGKRSLSPNAAVGEILVSRDLLRSAVMNPEQIVMEEIARDSGEMLEQEYMTGTGANEALGIFTAHADGIPTTRDVDTGNTDTAVTFDGLTRALMNQKLAYRNRSTWLFHRSVITQIMLIKDGNGQYIYKQAVENDRTVNLLLGRPVIESEWAPSTLTTGLYAGILGDFQWYWHVDQLLLEIQRLDELHARTNQVGYIARLKNDAAPMKAEAFTRVKLS